jgi:hypothetical protein
MAEAVESMGRFLLRALRDLPSSIGSNNLGVVFPLVPAILLFGITYYLQGWKAMKQDWIIAALVTVVSYALLYLYCIVRNVYRDHVSMCTKVKKAEADLQYLRDIPAWSGYANEQAWRNSIDEQNRLVNLGHLIDGLFSPLQVDAFLFVKELTEFLRESMTSFPERLDPRSSSTDEIHARSDERIVWRKRVESLYQLQFEEREKKLLLGFKAAGFNPHASFFSRGVQKIEEEIPRTIACIVVMAHEINHIKLAAREP